MASRRGITPEDRATDYDVLIGEEQEEPPDEGTAVSGGLGEWERIRSRERFRSAPRWYRHFFDR